MAKEPLDSIKIHKIRSLRLRGCSVKEIRAHLGHSVATISKYIQGDSISEKYKSILIDELVKENLNFIHKFTFLGYNPPYEVMNRRNEVMVELINYKF